jgi:hypothetical protein
MKQIFGTLVNLIHEMDLNQGGFDIDELVRSVSGGDSNNSTCARMMPAESDRDFSAICQRRLLVISPPTIV